MSSRSRWPPTATRPSWSGRNGACPWTSSPPTGRGSRSMSKISPPTSPGGSAATPARGGTSSSLPIRTWRPTSASDPWSLATFLGAMRQAVTGGAAFGSRRKVPEGRAERLGLAEVEPAEHGTGPAVQVPPARRQPPGWRRAAGPDRRARRWASAGPAVPSQPVLGLAVALVEPDELGEDVGVRHRISVVRPVASGPPDPAGLLIEVQVTESHGSQHRRAAPIRVHRVGDLLDGPAEHVSEDLAPDVGARAAADEPDRLQPAPGESLQRVQQPARIQRYPFQNGADQVAPAGRQRQVVESAAGEVVLRRCPLAVQPRGEDKAAAAWRGRRRHLVKLAVSIDRGFRGGEQQPVPEEGQRGDGGLLLIGDEVPAWDSGGQRGHVTHQVCLLERDVAGQPG